MKIEVRLPIANFGAFVQGLGWFIARRVPDLECDSTASALGTTDAAVDRWLYIRLRGRDQSLSLAVAREVDVVVVRKTVPRRQESAIRLLAEFCWQFSGTASDAEPGAARDLGSVQAIRGDRAPGA